MSAFCDHTEHAQRDTIVGRSFPNGYSGAGVWEHCPVENEIQRLSTIEFIHRGCDMLRRKDNEYLLNKIRDLEERVAELMVS